MWEAHFGAVYDAIPYTFYQCEDVVVLGVKDDLLQRRLFRISTCSSQFAVRIPTSSACNLSMSRSQRQTGFNRASVQADDAQSQLLDLASSLGTATQSQKEGNGKERWKSEDWYIGPSRKLERDSRLWSWVRSPCGLASALCVTLSAKASPHSLPQIALRRQGSLACELRRCLCTCSCLCSQDPST